jgi:hypothetical protein
MTTPNPSTPATTTIEDISFDPLALVAACVLPGLGHVVRKERARAAAICLGVLGLFGTGMLVGGIDVVDRREDTAYFIGQAFVGPIAFGVDYVHQSRFKVWSTQLGPNNKLIRTPLRSGFPGEWRLPTGEAVKVDAAGNPPASATKPATKSISKVNELGMLFGAIAGMLNLIAIIDAGFPTTRRRVSNTLGSAQPAAQKTAQANTGGAA